MSRSASPRQGNRYDSPVERRGGSVEPESEIPRQGNRDESSVERRGSNVEPEQLGRGGSLPRFRSRKRSSQADSPSQKGVHSTGILSVPWSVGKQTSAQYNTRRPEDDCCGDGTYRGGDTGDPVATPTKRRSGDGTELGGDTGDPVATP